MTILATSLFGSRARGDEKPGSDIDVLCWTDESFPRHVRQGPLSLAYYPQGDLLGKAGAGDLFAAHLAFEAVAIHDPEGLLQAFRAAYRPPPSYTPHVRAASELAFFLLDCGHALPQGLFNARSAWCARTIAIARSAEDGRMCFAVDVLSRRAGASALFDIAQAKDCAQAVPGASRRLEDYIRAFGTPRPLRRIKSPRSYKRRFETTGNEFGLKTLRMAQLRDEDGRYV